jgi:hypothetical protein
MMANMDKALRILSPLPGDIFRQGRPCINFTFLRIILFSPRSLRENLKTIWSSMTNDTTIIASRNEFRLRMLHDMYFRFNFHMIIKADILSFIQTSNMRFIIKYFKLNKHSSRSISNM